MAGTNKVKYNLKNVHYAKLTIGDDGTVTYATPVSIPGAVAISMEAQGELTPFYADGMTYFTSTSNNGYEGDLEIAMIPKSFSTDILGETVDTKKVQTENVNATISAFALLFEFEGDVNAIKHVLYNCKSTRPTIESQTSEDKKEVVTEKLSITATPLANGNVKAKTNDDTDQETVTNWYKNVYTGATETAA